MKKYFYYSYRDNRDRLGNGTVITDAIHFPLAETIDYLDRTTNCTNTILGAFEISFEDYAAYGLLRKYEASQG